MNDWVDIIRSDKFFNLIPHNLDNTIELKQKVYGGAFGISTTYETLYEIKNNPDELIKPPDYIAASFFCQSFTDDHGKPHSEDPAPTQRVSHLAFMWSKGSIPTKPKNEFTGFHRDDGYPALIEATNLRKHYYHGKLHRRNKRNPAIQADYLFAHWYQYGDLHRNNGPNQLLFRNYKEYWKDNIFEKRTDGRTNCCEHGWPKHHDNQKLNEFLSMIKGARDPYSNIYFKHSADEFRYMTEFGPE